MYCDAARPINVRKKTGQRDGQTGGCQMETLRFTQDAASIRDDESVSSFNTAQDGCFNRSHTTLLFCLTLVLFSD